MLHMIGAIVCLRNSTDSMNLLKNKNGLVKFTNIFQNQHRKSARMECICKPEHLLFGIPDNFLSENVAGLPSVVYLGRWVTKSHSFPTLNP